MKTKREELREEICKEALRLSKLPGNPHKLLGGEASKFTSIAKELEKEIQKEESLC